MKKVIFLDSVVQVTDNDETTVIPKSEQTKVLQAICDLFNKWIAERRVDNDTADA